MRGEYAEGEMMRAKAGQYIDYTAVSDSSMTALENSVNRALDELDRLRSINSDLVKALERITFRAEYSFNQTATNDGITNCDILSQARAALERAKQ